MGSVQNLPHFRSCDSGSVKLKFHLAQRLHVHILSRAPLCAGDVFQPGCRQAETGLTIGKGPSDPAPSSDFLHQPFQRIVRPDFAPTAVGEAVTSERLPDLLFDRISRFVQPRGGQFGDHSLGTALQPCSWSRAENRHPWAVVFNGVSQRPPQWQIYGNLFRIMLDFENTVF